MQTGSEVAGALVLPGERNGRLIVPEFAPPAPFLLKTAGIDPHPLYRSAGQPAYAVYELPDELSLPIEEQDATFAGIITLVGTNTLLAADRGSLQLVTIWRVEDKLPMDLAAFVHLTDEEGALIDQHDGFDAAPMTLRLGDLVLQRHELPLGETLPEGAYAMHIGLYTRGDGLRLERVGEVAGGAADQIVIPLDTTVVD